MNENVRLFEKYKHFKRSTVLWLILLFAVTGFFIFSVVLANDKDKAINISEAYSMENPAEVLVYCDVQAYALAIAEDTNGMEIWIMIDEQNKTHLLELGEKERAELKTIADYSFSEDENYPRPQPIRLYGIMSKTTDEIDGFAYESFEWYFNSIGEEFNAQVVEQYIPRIYMSVNGTSGSLEIAFAVIIGAIALIILVIVVSHRANCKSTQKRIKDRFKGIDLDAVLNYEIASENTQRFGKHTFITENFLIYANDGLFAWKIEPRLIVGKHTYYRNFIPSRSVYVKDGKKMILFDIERNNDHMIENFLFSYYNKINAANEDAKINNDENPLMF